MKARICGLSLGLCCVMGAYGYVSYTPEEGYTTTQTQAMDEFVAFHIKEEPVEVYGARCGTDWDCFTAWAEETHPVKHKRRGS